MSFFNRFPLIPYDIKGNGDYKLVTDILKRVKLRSGIQSGLFLYDEYDVEDAIHHYETTKDSGRTTSNGPNDYSHRVEVNSDFDNPILVTNREYEQRIQDRNRSIRLLNPRYLNQFITEFDKLINE